MCLTSSELIGILVHARTASSLALLAAAIELWLSPHACATTSSHVASAHTIPSSLPFAASLRVQVKIFAHFAALMDEEVQEAKRNSVFDDGVVDIRGQATG